MPDATFNTYYKQLNKAQKQAVDAIEGPVMVIAGPGTGKTQILTLRIANILKQTQVEPENILALTFTESGVASMRRRLAEIVGSAAYQVNISTFHGFANDVIGLYPESFPHIIGANNASQMEQIDIMQEVIGSSQLKELRPYGDAFHYLRPALTAIRDLKREGVTPEQLKELVDQDEKDFETIDDLYYDKGAHKGKMKGKYQTRWKHITKNKELVTLYRGYQKRLIDDRLYDYEDMIVEVLRALRDRPDLLLTLQEQYHYFLVDEHQDTNKAQNQILELLASFYDNPNLFVVGDEKQAIFRFQGASLENFNYFKDLYKDAQLITLEQNYRSTQSILDSAHELMSERKPQELVSTQKYDEHPITVSMYSSQDVEHYGIAQAIKQHVDGGVDPSDIAILYRTNREASAIGAMLGKIGVPYVIESDSNVLEDRNIQKLMLLLRAINHYGEPLPLIQALHIDVLDIDPLTVYELTQSGHNIYKQLNQSNDKNVKAFAKRLKDWNTMAHNEALPMLFETVVRESGLLAHLVQDNESVDGVQNIAILFDQIRSLLQNKRDYSLSNFIKHIDLLQEQNIPISSKRTSANEGRVHLLTAHRAKGLEFGYVYIANAVDKHWGNRRKFSSFELPASVYSLTNQTGANVGDNEDERNLFYVALTRAKREAHISYAHTRADGREQLASQFVSEIKPELLAHIETEQIEQQFKKQTHILFAAPQTTGSYTIKDKKYVQALFTQRGLSATQLNNYLECPWKYFYVNLLRVPLAKTINMMYGTAVHAALEDYFNRRSVADPDLPYLLDRFAWYMDQELFVDQDKAELLERGKQSLTGYHQHYNASWTYKTINELNIKGIELDDDIVIKGKLDKIEILDGKGSINVVDYKTGKPKSRGHIEGTTKDSNGNYKRQLIFYKLLLDHYNEGQYKMQQGVLDFVEPTDSGKYKKEIFEVTDQEVSELKEQIEQVAHEIRELTFWDTSCDNKDCQWCNLRTL